MYRLSQAHYTRSLLPIAALMAFGGCAVEGTPQYVFAPQASPLSVRLAPNAHSPRLAIDATGMLMLLAVYGTAERSQLAVLMSHDGGDTFVHKIDVSASDADVQGWGESSPAFAVGGDDYEHVVWQQTRDGRDELVASKMLLWGNAFDPAITVPIHERPATSAYPSVAVAGGTIFVTWLDDRPPHDKDIFPVYLGILHDGGKRFANVRVSSASCPCCRPAVLVGPDNTVYVAWRWVFPGDVRDIVVAASRDGGMTFGKPVRVHDDGWSIKGCPEAGPSLAFFRNRLYVAWHTVTPAGEQIASVAYSVDDGRTFSPPERVSRNILDANHPRLVATKTSLLLTFEGRDPQQNAGWGASRAYFAASDGGAFSDPQPLSDGRFTVMQPEILARDEATVFVAATQTRNGRSSIVLFRGRKNVEEAQ